MGGRGICKKIMQIGEFEEQFTQTFRKNTMQTSKKPLITASCSIYTINVLKFIQNCQT
jgi:hypothetical protein